MFKRFSAALAFACVMAGPSHALTLGFDVDVEPFPFLSADGPVTWYNYTNAIDGIDGTEFDVFFASSGGLLTSPTTAIPITTISGSLGFPLQSGLPSSGSLVMAVKYKLDVGPITFEFPAELVATVTDVEFELSNVFGPTIKVLLDVVDLETDPFFLNLFGTKLFGLIQIDKNSLPEGFDGTAIFDPSTNGTTEASAFFTMYRVNQTTGGGDGDGGSGGGDVSPVPLPASVPLLLAALGSLAWVRRRA